MPTNWQCTWCFCVFLLSSFTYVLGNLDSGSPTTSSVTVSAVTVPSSNKEKAPSLFFTLLQHQTTGSSSSTENEGRSISIPPVLIGVSGAITEINATQNSVTSLTGKSSPELPDKFVHHNPSPVPFEFSSEKSREICTNGINGALLVPENPFYLFSRQRVHPAISLALRKVASLSILDPSICPFNVTLIGDTNCDAVMGPVNAFDFVGDESPNRARVLFGPVCEYSLAPVGRYARFWDTPIITPGGLADDFSHKTRTPPIRASDDDLGIKTSETSNNGSSNNGNASNQNISPSRAGDNPEFTMLTRIGSSSHTLYNALIDLIVYTMHWRRIKIMREYTNSNQDVCLLIISALNAQLYWLEGELGPGFITYDVSDIRKGRDTAEVEGGSSPLENLLVREVGIEYSIIILCASADSVRDIMLEAARTNFTNGEYVFFNIDLFANKNETERPWYRKNSSEEENLRAREAYRSLMTVTLRKPVGEAYQKFSREVIAESERMFPGFKYEEDEVNSFVAAFHDAVLLYAHALNETLQEGGDISNGTLITRRMWDRTFEGITGNVSIDSNGDRTADYSLLSYSPKAEKFQVVGTYYGNSKQFKVEENKISWVGGKPPKDKPDCGFDGSGCPPDEPFPTWGVVTIIFSSILVVLAGFGALVFRLYRSDAELKEMNWRIRWEDISWSPGELDMRRKGRRGSRQSVLSHISGDSMGMMEGGVSKQLYIKIGYYKKSLIAIKHMQVRSVDVTKSLLCEMKRLKDLHSDHIVRFLGTCLDSPNECIITEYCQKGSLQDVLENDQLQLDWLFKYSLIQDIVKGMDYLHNSEIRSHGNLKSSNCLVNSRFVLKIADFGLHTLRQMDRRKESDSESHQYYKRQLWTAPELLRRCPVPIEGTQKGDVYSFAIICQEVVYRNGVFYVENSSLSPKETCLKVRNPVSDFTIFRPTMHSVDCDSEELATLFKKCWGEDPSERPDFHLLKNVMYKMNKSSNKGNIMDNLLRRMEQYANNLEQLVEDRTADYLEQKKKAEDLLYLMLPQSIASQLIGGKSVEAEHYSSVTIYFSDICGFTALSAASTPMQVVALLNSLYTAFDRCTSSFDVYKVETIGDAYMCVSGLPVRNGITHAREISRMSLALLEVVKSFKIPHRPDVELQLRIGIHSGPVVAGVVGLKMPRYCLFGDTVNTASRMESNGLPLRIHVSPTTKELLDEFKTFELEPRGLIPMKGKGEVFTYWLTGEEPSEGPLDEISAAEDPCTEHPAITLNPSPKSAITLPVSHLNNPECVAPVTSNGRVTKISLTFEDEVTAADHPGYRDSDHTNGITPSDSLEMKTERSLLLGSDRESCV